MEFNSRPWLNNLNNIMLCTAKVSLKRHVLRIRLYIRYIKIALPEKALGPYWQIAGDAIEI